jgi:nucleoside-triphosphatase THEP1
MKILLLTGAPGVGKTTVLRKVAAGLPDRRLAGFYTEDPLRRRETRFSHGMLRWARGNHGAD